MLRRKPSSILFARPHGFSHPFRMNSVDVVILTANRRALLSQCLASLAAGTRLPDRVVVVINETRDDTREYLDQTDFPFPLSIIDGPGGSFAEARNAGLAACTGDLVAFIDDDCEADRFWLGRLLDAMKSNHWVATGGPVIPATELDTPDWYAPSMAWAIGCSTPEIFGPTAGRREIPSTSNLAVARSLALEIGFKCVDSAGTNSFGYHAGGEDAQFWRDIRHSGVRTGIAPRAIVWHHVGQERLEREQVQARAELDGESFWAREHDTAAVSAAARDIVFTPIHAVSNAWRGTHTLTESWERESLWARRQLAFLEAAIDDPDHGIAPTTRSAAFVKEGTGAVFSICKSALRGLASGLNGSFRETRPIPSPDKPPRRLAVILHDMLGDAVLALPMLNQLSAAFPRTRIVVYTGPVSAPLLRANSPARTTIEELPPKARRGTLRAAAGFSAHLKKFDPDAVIVAYCHGLNPAPLFAPGSAPTIGWRSDNGFASRIWSDSLTVSLPKDCEKTEGALLLDLLSPLGIEATMARPRVIASAAARNRRDRVLAKAGAEKQNYALLQVEAETREKFWPVERFFAVADELHRQGLSVFLDGLPTGRIAAEKHLADRPWCHALHGLLNTDELAAMLEECALFVGCDSGPAHVARAVNAPAVLLFGMSDVARWKPLVELPGESLAPLRILEGAPGDLLPEEKRGLALNTGMLYLSVNEVFRAVSEVLDCRGKHPRGEETH